MLLRGRSHPRAVRWARGVSCGGCDELVRCRTKRTVRTKGNSLEANVEALHTAATRCDLPSEASDIPGAS